MVMENRTPDGHQPYLMDFSEEVEKVASAPARAYVRDRRAMASTPADVKEVPGALVFEIDMPGAKSGKMKVQVDDDNTLVISGRRRRARSKEAKYQRMERRMGKFTRKFPLPEDANLDAIMAALRDDVLAVRVEKKPPPESKTIEVKVGGSSRLKTTHG
ncbi:hypothetical protein B296_00011755 [Ensete ventricosum]|uniref:SHSP domain-containing protein n=1 Tax=Ensete ventricosum TaxID=4639 RepID=A0A426ZV70_ENSVE|nr:hypothetical protein B296_00011755 [Ensete ventricosum]